MFRQGTVKRGEAIISPGAKNHHSSHHSAVHSILHGKDKEHHSPSPSPSKKLSFVRKNHISIGGGGSGNNSDSNTNNNLGSSYGSDDEGSSTSLTLGSNDSWKKRPSSSPVCKIGGGVAKGTKNTAEQQLQYPPPPRPVHSFGEKRSYSFDLCQQQEDNVIESPVSLKSNSSHINANMGGSASSPRKQLNSRGKPSEPQGIIKRHPFAPPPYYRSGSIPTRLSRSDSDRPIQHPIQQSVDFREFNTQSGSNEHQMPLRMRSLSPRGVAENRKHSAPPPYCRPGPPTDRLSRSDSDRSIQHPINASVHMKAHDELPLRMRSLSPRGVSESRRHFAPPPYNRSGSIPDRLSSSDSDRPIQYPMQQSFEWRDLPIQSGTNKKQMPLRMRSLSPSGVSRPGHLLPQRCDMGPRVMPTSLVTRGQSKGHSLNENAAEDKMDDAVEMNEPDQQPPEQEQQRGRRSSLSRLGRALSRGRSRRKQGSGENTPSETVTPPSLPHNSDLDEKNTHDQASLMAVQVQPPPSHYSPLVSMPKQGNTRSVTTHSTYSEDPLSQADEDIVNALQDKVDGLHPEKKQSRRQRLQSSFMKHLKRGNVSRSYDRLGKLKQKLSDATPVTDESSTDRSFDGVYNFSNPASQESARTIITVYEDGSSTSLQRQSSTGTASSTVSSMLPNLCAESVPPNNSDNREWNPGVSLLSKMSVLQRIESNSGEEDSDDSKSQQNENADLEMEEIFYDPEEAYQSCSHSMFMKEMEPVEELDLSVEDKEHSSEYKKSKVLCRKNMDNLLSGLTTKKKRNGKSISPESEPLLSETKGRRNVRPKSISLRQILSRSSDEKEQKREAALRQAIMSSKHYQQLMKEQQQQELDEKEYREQTSDTQVIGSRGEEDRSSSPQHRRRRSSNSLSRNAEISHDHALAAQVTEADRRLCDNTNRSIERKNSQDSTDKSEGSSISRSSYTLSSKNASRSRRKTQRKPRCLICRQRLFDESKVNFVNFHFCADCFRCTSCRHSLVECRPYDSRLSGAQVVSSTRGNIVQCGDCAMHVKRVKSESSRNKICSSEDSTSREQLTLAEAAQDLADKAIVRITLANDDSDTEASHLSNVFFVWAEKEDDLAEFEASEQDKQMEKFLHNGNCDIDFNVHVKYKLDVLKHQHNQFLTLPQLESDANGRITDKFKIELELGLDDTTLPREFRPAFLSIEPFPTEEDPAKKVLRTMWSYECDGIKHEFRFTAQFTSQYGVAWQIFEGDKLDFTSCKLECFIDKVHDRGMSKTSPQEANPNQRLTSSTVSTSSARDELLDEVDEEKNIANSAKCEAPGRTSTDDSDGGVLVLRRKSWKMDPDREENDHMSELLSVASYADSHSISLPKIVHITVEKKPGDEIGLSLIEKNGTAVVSEVSKSGLFRSKLKEGCEILCVNGYKVTSPRSFLRMMKDFTGEIVIMASSSPSPPGSKFVVVKKPFLVGGSNEDEQQDISFKKVNGVVRVEEVNQVGIFAESDINEDDICLSINGVPAISENVAMRALTRTPGSLVPGPIALLVFSLSNFWKSMVELTIEAKYGRRWISDSECVLCIGDDDANSVKLSFNQETALCTIQNNADSDVRVKTMNAIISRVMSLMRESIQSYITAPKKKRDTSRSLSVSPSGKLRNASDVYKRALVKLDEMRKEKRLSEADYTRAKMALTENAIN